MRPLLIQFCTVLSLGAFSQKITPDNKVIIENFPQAATYSIQLQFSNGETTSLGSSKVYIGAMFPQLNKLKIIKDSGDVTISVTAGEKIDIRSIGKRTDLAKMLANYSRIEPLPAASAGKNTYFQPLTLSFRANGRVFYSTRTIGKCHQRIVDSNSSSSDDIHQEKSDALTSLEFLRSHMFKLAGNADQ